MDLFCYEKQRVRQVLAAKKVSIGEQQGDASAMVLEHEDPVKWKPFVPVWMERKRREMLFVF